MATTSLTQKGQTTIPKVIREYLHLHAGDKMEFFISDTGDVLLRPAVIELEQLKGMLKEKVQKSVSIEEMNKAIKQRAGKMR